MRSVFAALKEFDKKNVVSAENYLMSTDASSAEKDVNNEDKGLCVKDSEVNKSRSFDNLCIFTSWEGNIKHSNKYLPEF